MYHIRSGATIFFSSFFNGFSPPIARDEAVERMKLGIPASVFSFFTYYMSSYPFYLTGTEASFLFSIFFSSFFSSFFTHGCCFAIDAAVAIR